MSCGSTRRRHSPAWRRVVVIGLTSLLVLSACKTSATVELSNTATTTAPSGSDAAPGAETDDPSATNETTTSEPATSNDGDSAPAGQEIDEPSPTGGDGDSEPDGESPDDPAGSQRFVSRGEIPLTIEDVKALISFVETETGREFLRPPVLVAQPTEEFFAGLEEDISEFEETAESTVRSLQALGLTTKGVGEVSEAFIAVLLSPDGVGGYYDPEVDELYMPVGSQGDDAFRSVLVHELTHALDGQYEDLGARQVLAEEAEISGNFEPVLALTAVGEGRASSVQNRWMRANNVAPPAPPDTTVGPLSVVPPALLLSLSVPYVFGEQYIESLGGPANTWDRFDAPPASSEEFMVPTTPSGETIIDIPTPPADGPVFDEVVFGAADLFIWLLGESLEPPPSLIFPTLAAIDGWAGGKAVVWGDQSESCTRITLAADSNTDLEEIRDVIGLWAADSADRTVAIDGDRVTVTACAPFLP